MWRHVDCQPVRNLAPIRLWLVCGFLDWTRTNLDEVANAFFAKRFLATASHSCTRAPRRHRTRTMGADTTIRPNYNIFAFGADKVSPFVS